jgi:class 3 adenylate cyclase
MKRKIAAILAADAAEYSRLVAEDEEETLRQLVASIGVFKASVEAHGGRIFNTAGDAVLAEFQSAVQAVRSAIEIQHTLSTRNETSAPSRRLMFRMGISIGDVVENDGDLLGDGVNIAARLQSLSQPGGLAVSKWVQEQVAGKVTTEFHDTGYQHVKNMPGPIHVFQSRIAAAVPADREPHRTAPLPASARRWPFRSLAAGFAALIVAVVFFALTRKDPATVAVREVSPISAKQDDPASLPAVADQAPDQPPFAREPALGNALPDQSLTPKIEPASVETLTPPLSAPPPSAAALPAGEDIPAAPALEEPIEAALPPAPAASAPESSSAATLQQERSPETSTPPPPVLAQGTAADRKRQKVQCAQVLERAQLGDLTSDDQAFLRSKCR